MVTADLAEEIAKQKPPVQDGLHNYYDAVVWITENSIVELH